MDASRFSDIERRRPIGRATAYGLLLAVAWVAGTHGPMANAQAATEVLTGTQVNEERLLQALTPDLDGVRKRNLRVQAAAATIPAALDATRPSASLLITFRTSSSELTDDAKQQLDVVGAALKNARLASYRFIVEGHADPRGDAAANLVLSQQRAGSVRSYLVSEHGIDPMRLIPEGKGDREVLNRAVPAAPENRRVTLITNVH
ncbi:MAG: OmpA family protein [Burkholderiaceae bacterium]|nr:OmpA family protein [Burkholderiaceae bacterium]